MAQLPNVTHVMVTGDYRDTAGRTLYGTVTFTPTMAGVADGDVFVLPSPVQARVINGRLAVALAVSDDPDLLPNGLAYNVVEDFGGQLGKYQITLRESMGPIVDLTEIAPQPPRGPQPTPAAGVQYVATINGLAGDVFLDELELSTATIEALGTKQPLLPTGGTTQFLRGSDKTFVSISKTDVGLSNVDNTADVDKPAPAAVTTALAGKQDALPSGGATQFLRGSDKTFVSLAKTDVGLGSVDNTADASKPVSTAQATALAGKQDSLPTGGATQFLRGSDKTFVSLAKTDVGLANVDNTADASKPVSTATATALSAKLNTADVVKASGNVALGSGAQPAPTGANNIAIGSNVQSAITSGASNVAIGRSSQLLVTSGAANTVVGDAAQNKLTTANFSTAVGSSAQTNLTTGTANVALGASAQFDLTTGGLNTAVGHRAQYGPAGLTANATTTASQQTSVGYESGQADATQSAGITTMGYRAIAAGTGSTALGQLSTASGAGSTAVGPSTTASGAGGVAVGSGAQATAANASAFGFGAAATAAGAIAIGRDSAGSPATTATADDIVLGTWKHSMRTAIVNGTANVAMFRITGDADDTLAIKRAVASGAKRIHFPAGTYTVNISAGVPLASWTGVNGVFVDAGQATIVNDVSYAFQGTLTPVFQFDNCKNIRVELGGYVGQVLANPGTDHGYRGATFVRLINGCDGAVIRGTLTNLRYGVQSGEYADETKGGCRNIDVKLRTFFCGYPVALYLCDGVRFDIDADDVHRVAYLAGVWDARGVARWKNQWTNADTVLLITDAKTGSVPTNTSRGCQDLDVTSIDKGSTVFYITSYCAGIALSRADPDIRYENIKVKVFSRSTDTLSCRVGGFRILSGVTSLSDPNYVDFNWLASIVFRNITVSGVMDHSAQTVDGNVTGDFSIRGYDYLVTPNNWPTIENLVFEDLVIKASSTTNKVPSLLAAPLLTGAGATFRRVDAPGTILTMETNPDAFTVFEESNFLKVVQSTGTVIGGTGARTRVSGGAIAQYQNDIGATQAVQASSGTLNGAGAAIQQKQVLATLTGASVTLTDLIPANATVLGVQGRITTAITGATGFQIGVSGALTRYADISATTVGSTFSVADADVGETGPRLYRTNTSVVVTAKGSNFTAGVLRVIVHYISFVAPTA